jgi:hypothetical protein
MRLSLVLDDLNILNGNFLGIGLIVMSFCPLLSSMLHRVL